MNCLHCQAPLPADSRRDRKYCNNNCRAWASTSRRPERRPAPAAWRHQPLESEDPALAAAAYTPSNSLTPATGAGRRYEAMLDGLATLLRTSPPATGCRSPRFATGRIGTCPGPGWRKSSLTSTC